MRASLALVALVLAGGALAGCTTQKQVPPPAAAPAPNPVLPTGPAYTAFRCPSSSTSQATPCSEPWAVPDGAVSTSLAVHPTRSGILAIAYETPVPQADTKPQQTETLRSAIAVSTDGGRTWTSHELPTVPAAQQRPYGNPYGFTGGVQLAFTPDGLLHAVGAGAIMTVPPATNHLYSEIGIHASTADLGTTWNGPVAFLPENVGGATQLLAMDDQTLLTTLVMNDGSSMVYLTRDAGTNWTRLDPSGVDCGAWGPFLPDGQRVAGACVAIGGSTFFGQVHAARLDLANGTLAVIGPDRDDTTEGTPPDACHEAFLARAAAAWVLVSGECLGIDVRTSASLDGPWRVMNTTGSPLDAWPDRAQVLGVATDPAGGVLVLMDGTHRGSTPQCDCPQHGLLVLRLREDAQGVSGLHEIPSQEGLTPFGMPSTGLQALAKGQDAVWFALGRGAVSLGLIVPA